MKKYISPVAIENDILAEAIYAASGVEIPNVSEGDNTGDGENDNTGSSIPIPPPGERQPNVNYTEAPYAPDPSIDYQHDSTCWSIGTEKGNFVPSEGYVNFRIDCAHHTGLVHISEKTEVVLTFDKPVTYAEFERTDFDCSASGCTVTLTRNLMADSYNSGDNYNSLVKVYTSDYETITCTNAAIYCTHGVNVQGGFD